MYINHITITSGQISTTSRSDVSDEILAILSPWLKSIVNTDHKYPLPVAELKEYCAIAHVIEGGLLMTIYEPPNHKIPIVTIAIAQRSRHSDSLWSMMLASYEHAPDLKQPSTPWSAVALHPIVVSHPEYLKWIEDFERCVAWAWVTRNPDLQIHN